MIYNKKGLSTVVTTLIIILLVLVAIGIIWVVIRGVIETGSEEIDLSTKCLSVDVRVTNTTGCSATTCTNVRVYRKTGSEPIGGVALIFHNSSLVDSSDVYYSIGDIQLLNTKTIAPVNIAGLTGIPNKVDIVPFFKNEKGQNQLCTQVNSYEF